MSKISKQITNSKIYFLVLLYLLFGIIFFANRHSNYGYLECLTAVISDAYIVSLFYIPSLAVITGYTIKTLNQDIILLRLKKRKKIISFFFKKIQEVIIVVFISILLMGVIITNLSVKSNFIIRNNGLYDNNIVVLIVSIIKLYFLLTVISIMTLQSFLITKKRKFFALIPAIYLVIYYFSSYILTRSKIINFFLPYNHLSGMTIYDTTFESVLTSFSFYISIILMIILSLNKKIIKFEFLEENND